MEKEFLAELHYKKLISRFRLKIEPWQYYLSYSGGHDSHLLYWFVKREKIPGKIISVNAYREHNEIRKRMYDHADKVVYPTMLFEEIKEKYGIPYFTKSQDEIIKRYQGGSRSANTLGRVYGSGTTIFGLNNKACELLVSGKLHNISAHCCKYTKKEPLALYEKENGLKPKVYAVLVKKESGSINVVLPSKKIKSYFLDAYTKEQMEKVIYLLLEQWKESGESIQ